MSLSIQVNGVTYNEAESIRYRRSLLDFCGFYSVSSSANESELLPVKIGDKIKIFADGEQVLIGYIDNLSVTVGSGNHKIEFSGRDRTCDAFDSTVVGTKSFANDIGYVSVLRSVLDAGEMSSIGITNEAGNITNFSETDNVSAEVGETIFDFANRYAAKLGFLLTSNEDGNILLCQAGSEKLGFNLLHENGNSENNILSSSYKKTIENRFNKYTAVSQLGTYGLGDEITPENVVDQSGETGIDENIRSSRNLTFEVEELSGNESCGIRANFEANIRRAKSLNYCCNIQGHSYDGEPFKVNRLATINDDFSNIYAEMLLHTVEMNWSLRGSTSRLSFSYKDAFTLQAALDKRSANRSSYGDDF